MGDHLIWQCDECGRPVGDGAGYVGCDYRAAMSRSHDLARIKVVAAAEHEADGSLVTVRLSDIPSVQLLCWYVFHRTCDPAIERVDYWISVNRIRTVSDLLHWNEHLFRKDWVASTDWGEFLAMAWRHTVLSRPKGRKGGDR